MDAETLKNTLDDVSGILAALARLMPNRVPDDLLTFISDIKSSPMQIELLLGTLALLKQVPEKAVRR